MDNDEDGDDSDGDDGDGDENIHLSALPPYEIVGVKSSTGDAADKRQPRLQADVDVWSTVYAGNWGCKGDYYYSFLSFSFFKYNFKKIKLT